MDLASDTEAWTLESLTDLRERARRMGKDFDLQQLAMDVRRSKADVNVALHALTGRSVAAAVLILSGQDEPAVWVKRPRLTVARFLTEMFSG
jgi:hypothetical protein